MGWCLLCLERCYSFRNSFNGLHELNIKSAATIQHQPDIIFYLKDSERVKRMYETVFVKKG